MEAQKENVLMTCALTRCGEKPGESFVLFEKKRSIRLREKFV
jgi:hypothetical protein